jgi:hypothetical protein
MLAGQPGAAQGQQPAAQQEDGPVAKEAAEVGGVAGVAADPQRDHDQVELQEKDGQVAGGHGVGGQGKTEHDGDFRPTSEVTITIARGHAPNSLVRGLRGLAGGGLDAVWGR